MDADEATAGQPGDGADAVTASVAVCREDELFWLDATVIGQLPKDIPNPSPPPVEQHALEAVRATFVAGLEAGEEHTGVLSRMASAVTGRRTPLPVDPISPSALPPLPPTAVPAPAPETRHASPAAPAAAAPETDEPSDRVA